MAASKIKWNIEKNLVTQSIKIEEYYYIGEGENIEICKVNKLHAHSSLIAWVPKHEGMSVQVGSSEVVFIPYKLETSDEKVRLINDGGTQKLIGVPEADYSRDGLVNTLNDVYEWHEVFYNVLLADSTL